MKTLYLIRHAKAEAHTHSKTDYHRDIVEKGIDRTNLIIEKLQKEITKGNTIQVLSSSANRAIQTAVLFCHALQYATEKIREDKSIYEAHYLDILNSINQTSSDIDTLLVFGHNPGLSHLVDYLTNRQIDLKTSHAAVLELEEEIDFRTLSGGTATLKYVISE